LFNQFDVDAGNTKIVKGLVFDIQHFSTHDGPGIRTTVFLKGCPLTCAWCHNPESQSPDAELFFNLTICIDCKSCNKVCPYGMAREILRDGRSREEKCGSCSLCADACPAKAIERIGEIYTSDEIVAEIEKDLPFYENSNGGVTISGGEPMFQFDFTIDLLKKIKKKKIHTVIETSGFASKERFLNIVPYVDLFLWDIKVTDQALHEKFTGNSLRPIIENLKLIDKEGAKTILRLIIIPGVNMNNSHYEHIADIYSELANVQGIELLPYHQYGNSKKEKLGFTDYLTFNQPTDQDIDRIFTAFNQIDPKIKLFS